MENNEDMYNKIIELDDFIVKGDIKEAMGMFIKLLSKEEIINNKYDSSFLVSNTIDELISNNYIKESGQFLTEALKKDPKIANNFSCIDSHNNIVDIFGFMDILNTNGYKQEMKENIDILLENRNIVDIDKFKLINRCVNIFNDETNYNKIKENRYELAKKYLVPARSMLNQIQHIIEQSGKIVPKSICNKIGCIQYMITKAYEGSSLLPKNKQQLENTTEISSKETEQLKNTTKKLKDAQQEIEYGVKKDDSSKCCVLI